MRPGLEYIMVGMLEQLGSQTLHFAFHLSNPDSIYSRNVEGVQL